jgi:CHAT domain-containing protein
VVDTLGEKTIAQYARLATADGNGPMIYLNACQTGRQGYKLTGVGGFADAFLRAGASVFIGALWSIGDETAMEFCRAFYASLWAGHTLTEAAIAARNEARKIGDATWLAYVIYGHPHFRIKTQDPI